MNTDELVFRDIVLGDLRVADFAVWCESLVTHGNDDEDVIYLAPNPDLHWEQFDAVIRKIKDKTELGSLRRTVYRLARPARKPGIPGQRAGHPVLRT